MHSFFIEVSVLIGLLLLSGCGRTVTITLTPSPATRGSVALGQVRSVDLIYREQSGQERFRETFAVENFNEPFDASTDRVEEMEWTDGGRWEAHALSDHGKVLLSGSSVGSDDKIEIVLSEISSSVRAPVVLAPQILPTVPLQPLRLTYSEAPYALRGDPSTDGRIGMTGYVYAQNVNALPVNASLTCKFSDTTDMRSFLWIGQAGHSNFGGLQEECKPLQLRASHRESRELAVGASLRMSICGHGNPFGGTEGTSLKVGGFGLSCEVAAQTLDGKQSSFADRSFSID